MRRCNGTCKQAYFMLFLDSQWMPNVFKIMDIKVSYKTRTQQTNLNFHQNYPVRRLALKIIGFIHPMVK